MARMRRVAPLVAATASLVATTSLGTPPQPTLEAHYVRAGTVRLRYARAGHGRPVVLLHGYGESLVTWRPLFDALSADADVIALDLPGAGLSDKVGGSSTPYGLASVILQALDALDAGDSVVIVGHSLGGAVAAAAANGSSRVGALVLIAPALSRPAVLGPRDGAFLGALRRRLAVGYEVARGTFGTVHDPWWLREDDGAAAYEPYGDSAYVGALEAVLHDFDFDFLAAPAATPITVPTLVIWGAADPLVTRGRTVPVVQRGIPGAAFTLVARSWHRPHVERPGQVLRLIRSFLGSDLPRMASPGH